MSNAKVMELTEEIEREKQQLREQTDMAAEERARVAEDLAKKQVGGPYQPLLLSFGGHVHCHQCLLSAPVLTSWNRRSSRKQQTNGKPFNGK